VETIRNIARISRIFLDDKNLYGFNITGIDKNRIRTKFTILEIQGFMEYRTIDIDSYLCESSHTTTFDAKLTSASVHNEVIDNVGASAIQILNLLQSDKDKFIESQSIHLPTVMDISNATITDVRLMDRLRDKVTNYEYLDIDYRLCRFENVIGKLAIDDQII
jgi:hypothetical protein